MDLHKCTRKLWKSNLTLSLIGAIIMPHNLYLHSALVKSRKVDNRKSAETKDANRYVLIESAIALFVSFLINLSVTSVFAKGLYGKTNNYVYNLCTARGNASYIDFSVLKNDNDTFEADLYKGGLFLGCQFGAVPFYIWGIGILAAGQSSTMTGTYSGQFAMEGFLNLKWPRWQRVLLTRTIAIAPTLAVTLTSSGKRTESGLDFQLEMSYLTTRYLITKILSITVDKLTGMNDYLNALMVIQLPFAILPTLTFSSSKIVMGKFSNNTFNRIVATILSLVVVFINIYFVMQTLLNIQSNFNWLIYIIAGIYGVFYVVFVLYLVSIRIMQNEDIPITHFFIQCGCYLSVLNVTCLQIIPGIGKYFIENNKVEYKYIE